MQCFLWDTFLTWTQLCVAYLSQQLQTLHYKTVCENKILPSPPHHWSGLSNEYINRHLLYIVEWRLANIVFHWLKKNISLQLHLPRDFKTKEHTKSTISMCLFLFMKDCFSFLISGPQMWSVCWPGPSIKFTYHSLLVNKCISKIMLYNIYYSELTSIV